MSVVKRSIVINTPPNVLFGVITDYEQYPQFLKEVERIEVLKQTPSSTRVRYTVNLIKKVQYTIDLVSVENESVSWSLVESGIMKINSGGWELKDLGDGTTEATYSIEVVPKGLLVPKRILHMLTDKSLPSTMSAFKNRAESLNSNGAN